LTNSSRPASWSFGGCFARELRPPANANGPAASSKQPATIQVVALRDFRFLANPSRFMIRASDLGARREQTAIEADG
jgi:hypothetical protein